ncbi:MAG: hypothetical protein ABI400_10370 [Lacisediminihabitans sp.]
MDHLQRVGWVLKSVEPQLDNPMVGELTATVGLADVLQGGPESVLDVDFALRRIIPVEIAKSREFRDAVVSQFSEVRRLTASPRSSNGQ